MIVHSWRHATPAHRIDHDTAQWFPPSRCSPIAAVLAWFASKQPKAHILTYLRACGLYPPERSPGSRAAYKSHLQLGLCEGTRGAGICEVSPHPSEPSSFHTHTHQKLISSTTVERTAHGGIGGHAAHCSFTTTGARSWNSDELPRPVNAYAPNQQPNEAERIGRVREREASFEWELPFGEPEPADFALDTIAIVEYSIAFDASESTCRPRRVRCLQVLPVTRNELNEGMVAGTIWVSHTWQSRPLNTAPQTIPKTTRFLLPCGPFTTSPPGGLAGAICLSPPLRSSLPLALSTPSTLLTRNTAPGGYNASIAGVVQSTKLSAEVIAVETALLPRIKGCGGPTDQLSGRRVIDRCRKQCAQANLQCRKCSAPVQQVVFTRDGIRCRNNPVTMRPRLPWSKRLSLWPQRDRCRNNPATTHRKLPSFNRPSLWL